MPSPASVFALAALFASVAATASAQSADPVLACVNRAGKLRIVVQAGQCKASETALSWNQAGPAGPPGPAGQPAPRLELVGFTTATVAGGAGIFEWTRTCGAEFAGARVCQVSELVLDATPPSIASPEDFAWVLPDINESGQLTGITPSGGTCAANDNSGGIGAVVNGHGFFGFRVCSEAHRVTCCAPLH